MRYWVVKGNPSENDLDEMLQSGVIASWRTGKPPKLWARGDRVFFWSSAPRLELVGLGELIGPTGQFTEQGETIYHVKYLTDPLAKRVSAATLRANTACGGANFLKPAVAQGVLQVQLNEAHEMYRLMNGANGNSLRCWQDISLEGRTKPAGTPSKRVETLPRSGQGFGEAESNKSVEFAAVQFASLDYARRGWTVRSVEADKCGYDLECRRSGTLECIEVKGTSGKSMSFIITAGELSAAKRIQEFVLLVVTDALGTPKPHRFSGSDIVKRFTLDPIAFRATPKRSGR